MSITDKQFQSFWVYLSFTLYLACFYLPALYIKSDYEPVLSIHLLGFGWIGLLSMPPFWLSNPLFFIAALSFNKPSISILFSFAALLLGVSFLFYGIIPNPHDRDDVTSYGWGYCLWILSFGVFALTQFFRCTSKGRINRKLVIGVQLIFIFTVLTVFLIHYCNVDRLPALNLVVVKG